MKVINKRYSREFKELETFEAGIVLTGAETKSVKLGNIKLDEAFVKIVENEAYLFNAHIPHYKFADPEGYNPSQMRKLLLHKDELIRIQTKLNSGNLTVIPISCYNKGTRIKLQIALSQGKKTWETKKVEKEQDIKRETAKELKEYLRTQGMHGIDVLIALLKTVRSDLSVKWKKTQAEAEQAEAAMYAQNYNFAFA